MTENDAACTKVNAASRNPLPELMPSRRKRNAAVFGVVAVAWLMFDLLTKVHFNTFTPGEIIAGPFLGLFRFRLVHNTGAAWGLFGDSTFILGVLSIVICMVLVAYLFALSPRASIMQVIGIALVFAGGIGNAVDRFTLSYVVDFIDLAFIDFPVFNIADIGVTCGFVLFLGALLFEWSREKVSAKVADDRESHD